MPFGEVAEWLNAAHSKCVMPLRVSGVRIPPSPLNLILSLIRFLIKQVFLMGFYSYIAYAITYLF